LNRAVHSGYLSYDDCQDLSKEKLVAREVLASESEKEASYVTLLRDRILQHTILMPIYPADSRKELAESISENQRSLLNLVFNTNKTAEEVSKSYDDKYEAVFGKVSDEDIKALNDYLSDHKLRGNQIAESKENALLQLSKELADKAGRRRH